MDAFLKKIRIPVKPLSIVLGTCLINNVIRV